MNITILINHKKLDKQYINAISEYEKRLSRYCKIKYICTTNSDQINKYNTKDAYHILIDYSVNSMDSVELSKKINEIGLYHNSNIIFYINVNNIKYDEKLSVSQMDMSCDLLTTVMFEQIYRSYRILNNEPYHK